MRQKISALIISLLSAIYVANAINHALPVEPPRLQYDRTVTLTGTLSREFDMAFVDPSLVPYQDPDRAEKAAREARREHPGDPSLRAPIPHLILRLDKPVAVQQGPGDGLHPATSNITEIDLGDVPSGQFHIYGESLDKGLYAVTGTLLHASTDHQLRPIVLAVADIRPDGR